VPLEPLYQSCFCVCYYRDRVLWTICWGWLETMVLLMSASWVARITCVNHFKFNNSQPWVHIKVKTWRDLGEKKPIAWAHSREISQKFVLRTTNFIFSPKKKYPSSLSNWGGWCFRNILYLSSLSFLFSSFPHPAKQFSSLQLQRFIHIGTLVEEEIPLRWVVAADASVS
jgi:hypothetical protein